MLVKAGYELRLSVLHSTFEWSSIMIICFCRPMHHTLNTWNASNCILRELSLSMFIICIRFLTSLTYRIISLTFERSSSRSARSCNRKQASSRPVQVSSQHRHTAASRCICPLLLSVRGQCGYALQHPQQLLVSACQSQGVHHGCTNIATSLIIC